ncbi:MAG TPA: response regulator [Planctomycetota bacterium]|nr:response regulator [Planctomycetota bacterium]
MTGRIRVLIVDDVRLVLTSLRRMLERVGFHVEAAESGAAALALLEGTEVDVILSDFMMPGMNGIELLGEVAAKWPRVRRAMLTAQADKELLDRALADGLLHAAFQKPWDNLELAEALRALAVPVP